MTPTPIVALAAKSATKAALDAGSEYGGAAALTANLGVRLGKEHGVLHGADREFPAVALAAIVWAGADGNLEGRRLPRKSPPDAECAICEKFSVEQSL